MTTTTTNAFAVSELAFEALHRSGELHSTLSYIRLPADTAEVVADRLRQALLLLADAERLVSAAGPPTEDIDP